MTDEQYDKAYSLKSTISNLQNLIDFVGSQDVKASIGQVDDIDGEVIVPLEDIYSG